MSQGPRFCWILESDLREFLQKQKRDAKHGKSRKLSKADLAAVEEKLQIHDMRNFTVSRVPNHEAPVVTREQVQEGRREVVALLEKSRLERDAAAKRVLDDESSPVEAKEIAKKMLETSKSFSLEDLNGE